MSGKSTPETPAAEASERPYAALTERALAYITTNGGSVPEDVLVRHVFGNSGSPAIWRPLLRNVLAGEGEKVLLVNEHWSLIRESTTSGAEVLNEFIAIDVETTGLKPSSQRIIEIALYRYRQGKLAERYETLLNPGREIPAFITNLTSIRNEDVEYAPGFAEVAEQVVEFIGDALLIGHNVRFDISFMNAELKRVDREPLINERLDTLTLAVRYIHNLRKPSLDRVASALGLPPRRIHRAGGDAQMTAEAALRLVEMATRTGVSTIDDLKGGALPGGHRPRDDVGRARAVLDLSLIHI